MEFIVQSVNPSSIILITGDVEKLEEYVGALGKPCLGLEVVAEITRIYERLLAWCWLSRAYSLIYGFARLLGILALQPAIATIVRVPRYGIVLAM